MEWRIAWKPLAAALVGAGLLWTAFVLGERIPLLSMFDLGIHELGHLITSPLGTTVSFAMGSGLQVAVPLGLGAYFWFGQHDRIATGLLLCWGATSMQDSSVYIADAPHRSLQLIGGTHDWWWLLSRWGRLDWAEEIAGGVWLMGLGAGLTGLIIIARPLAVEVWHRLGSPSAIQVPGPQRVRPPRPPA